MAMKYREVYKHIAPEVLNGSCVTTGKKISSTILLQLANAATDINPTKKAHSFEIIDHVECRENPQLRCIKEALQNEV
ncbi:Hypothetical predicted protein [Paramuricea clavata]|uniref:Uncharacterized protein n=1 Tax=Paramuricea clavata TaxID=317549 RepID=A0A7D9ILN2_PARCT|nr:Hypothetical predicted protein [Paramuricea clavata]